jgi:hypothetical protein
VTPALNGASESEIRKVAIKRLYWYVFERESFQIKALSIEPPQNGGSCFRAVFSNQFPCHLVIQIVESDSLQWIADAGGQFLYIGNLVALRGMRQIAHKQIYPLGQG